MVLLRKRGHGQIASSLLHLAPSQTPRFLKQTEAKSSLQQRPSHYRPLSHSHLPRLYRDPFLQVWVVESLIVLFLPQALLMSALKSSRNSRTNTTMKRVMLGRNAGNSRYLIRHHHWRQRHWLVPSTSTTLVNTTRKMSI